MNTSVRFTYCLLSITAFMFLGIFNVTNATVFTMTSPIGPLPNDVSQVGGLVFQAKGHNGTVVTSQLSAASLYQGFASSNPQLIGTQTGFTPAIRSALGGGLSHVAVRVTLYDGDTATGNFDFNRNFLQINGFEHSVASNFSNVMTEQTNNTGTVALRNPISGFDHDRLHTGFFSFTDSNFLDNVWNSMQGGSLLFSLRDTNPFDNMYDFKQGVNSSFAPTVTTAVPEPTSLAVISLIPLYAAIRSRYARNKQKMD